MELLSKELTEKIIGVCFDVSNELGHGFLESVYQKAVCMALVQKGMEIEEQVPLEVRFRGQVVGDFIADIVVEKQVVLELKSIKMLTTDHEAQLINYLKATGIRIGF